MARERANQSELPAEQNQSDRHLQSTVSAVAMNRLRDGEEDDRQEQPRGETPRRERVFLHT